MNTFLNCLLTAVIATAVGWVINQLPPLKSNVSTRVRVVMTIALTVIAGTVAAWISVANSQAPARESDAVRAPVTSTSTSTSSFPAPHSRASSSAASEPPILQSQAKLSLQAGQSADLDQVDANWGTPGIKQQPGGDIYANNSGNLEVEPGHLTLAILGQEGNYRACASATNWADEVINPKAGMAVCAKTDRGRMALLFIRDISRSTKKVFQMEATVWEN